MDAREYSTEASARFHFLPSWQNAGAQLLERQRNEIARAKTEGKNKGQPLHTRARRHR